MTDAPYNATNIRAWRKARKMSLAVLADQVGMDKGNLSKLERGEHPYRQDTIEKIAAALNTTVAGLLTRSPEDPTPIWDYIAKAKPTVRRQIEEAAAAIYRAGNGE